MTNLTAQIELMKNQKHTTQMPMQPGLPFDVIQAADSSSIFISIGTDQKLWATLEAAGSTTGWTSYDLGKSLSSAYKSDTQIGAKTFAVWQNAQGSIDLALAVTDGNTDTLHFSLNNSSDPSTWNSPNGLTWTSAPPPASVTIADVYLMNIPSQSGAPIESCFVDVVDSGTHSNLNRWFVTLSGTPQWTQSTMPDLDPGTVSSCLGNVVVNVHGTKTNSPGIYTFGTVNGKAELSFLPQYSLTGGSAPTITSLPVSDDTTAIASTINSDGTTNIYYANPQGLHLLTPSQQTPSGKPIAVHNALVLDQNNMFSGLSRLIASIDDSRTVVWALGGQGSIFQLNCPVGSETDPTAWTNPFPVASNVEGFAFYLDSQFKNDVVFAQQSGQNLIQLSRSVNLPSSGAVSSSTPSNSLWIQRSILLSTVDINETYEYYSCTTHIAVTDDNGRGLSNKDVFIKPTSSTTVYINGVYQQLTAQVSFTATSDTSGNVSIVEETQSLSGTYFWVSAQSVDPILVDPTAKSTGIVSQIQTVDDLGKVVSLQNAPSGIPQQAVDCLKNLMKAKATLPADGTIKSDASQASRLKQPKNVKDHHMNTEGIVDWIETSAGDLYNGLKNAVEGVADWVCQELEDGWHFVVTIGESVWHALVDCANAVMSGIDFVFSQLKVAWDDLVALFGFLFNWSDVLRTHDVLKNIFRLYLAEIPGQLARCKQMIDSDFGKLEALINNVTGLSSVTDSYNSLQQSGQKQPALSSPQSNWAQQHLQQNVGSSDFPKAEGTASIALTTLTTFVTNEEATFKTALSTAYSDVSQKIDSMSPSQILGKIAKLVGDLFVATAQNVFDALLDVLIALVDGLVEMFTAKIDIPVISWAWKTFISPGNELSLLDLICLLGAVPVTVVYKAATAIGNSDGVAPYPDNSTTANLSNAPDLATLSKYLNGNQQSSAALARPGKTTFAEVKDDPMTITNLAMDILAFEATFFVNDTAVVKRALGDELAPKPLRAIAFGAYVLYCAPNLMNVLKDPHFKDTGNLCNDIITVVSIVKCGLDNWGAMADHDDWKYISPCIESIINGAWWMTAAYLYAEIPSPQLSDQFGLAANFLFDVSGMLTPIAERAIGGQLADPCFALCCLLNTGYGTISATSGLQVLLGT